MDNCIEIIEKIKKDLINFYDNYFLLKKKNKEFYLHYLCSAQIASKIGFATKEYSDPVRNEALYFATLYCDIGLDYKLKMGENIEADEKIKVLKSHVKESMEILKSGNYFFRNSILIIAWHHYQPDGKGYMPEDFPKLNLYKVGGAIVSIATAFDSIFKRNLKKSSDFIYSFAVAIAKLKQYSGTQFDGKIFDIFYKLLKKGISINIENKSVLFKINDIVEEKIENILSDNIFFNENVGGDFCKDKKKKDSPKNLDFNTLFNAGIKGDLYNVEEIVNHLEKMIKILKTADDREFNEYFIKILVFMSQFKYPDGEIKSFLVDAFFNFVDRYFSDIYHELYKKILNIWVAYIKDELQEELKSYLETYLSNFIKLIIKFQRSFQVFDKNMFESIKKISNEKEKHLTEELKHIYDPELIDRIKETIENFKYFINSIQPY